MRRDVSLGYVKRDTALGEPFCGGIISLGKRYDRAGFQWFAEPLISSGYQ